MQYTNQLSFKIIIVGDSNVGKSCLLMRYVDNNYTPNHYPTIGLEFLSKQIAINDFKVKLQIWDTAGQQAFKSIVRNFYKNSDAVFIVYSIVDRKSFESISQWFAQANENTPQQTIYILIGSQKDLQHRRQVKHNEGEQIMRKFKMDLFFETSALQDLNIDLAFEQTAKQLFLKRVMRSNKTVVQQQQGCIKLQQHTTSGNINNENLSSCC